MQPFDKLFHEYFERVYRFALSLTRSDVAAEELTQQTFFKALKSIDSFQGRSEPITWLCSIAKNEYFNQQRRREEAAPPDAPVFQRGDALLEAALLEKEQLLRLHRHLHALEEPYREVFMLRVFGELKYAQIGALFGKAEGWARVTFYRAKCALQGKIKKEETHEP
ncbi:MAG: RNA polymerase sigma factor [Oscillospiraceae bacterium]|jgi:RNA polymerase sigma-70 factor (ECF subfamily)|nr:RNA polymerase sigma factor [Oscillospiraceae bacterium]